MFSTVSFASTSKDKIIEKVSDIRGAKIAIDSDGHIWVGGVGRLYCYNGIEWSTIALYEPIYPDDICNELAILPDGKIWYVTEYENCMIYEYDPQTGSTTKLINRISSIAVGNDGVVLCGSVNGLLRFDGVTWENISEDDWPDKWIRDVSIDHNGYIWIATSDGIRCFDGESWTFHVLPGRDYLEGTDIAFDVYDNVWVSTIWGQVYRYDSTQWISYTCPNGSYPQSHEIRIA